LGSYNKQVSCFIEVPRGTEIMQESLSQNPFYRKPVRVVQDFCSMIRYSIDCPK